MAKQIFLWYGSNDFEVSQTISSWIKIFEKKYSGLNLVKLDMKSGESKDTIVTELKNSLQVNSLFGSNKFIILKNFLAADVGGEITDLLLKYLEKEADGFFIVFTQVDKPDARSKLYKQLTKLEKAGQAEIKEFSLPTGYQLSGWINQRLKKLNAPIEPKAVELLIAMVGNDLWHLDSEINKLASYKNGEMISAADVNLLVKGKFNDDIFQLMDAIGRKDKKRAIDLMQDQLDSGANEIYLFTMLVRQFRLLRQIKEMLEIENVNNKDQIARELKLHPFVVQKTMGQAGYFDRVKLKKIYQELLEFELALKTKNIDFKILFDKFIVNI